jgi:hypothetical protein
MLLPALCIAALILTPFFIQNSVCTGHWYMLSQHSEASAFIPAGLGGTGDGSGLSFTNLFRLLHSQSHIYGLKGTPVWTSFLFVLIMLAGVWGELKNAVVIRWILVQILLLTAFYSATNRDENIYNLYMSSTYYVTVFLAVCGVRRIFNLLKRNKPEIMISVSLIALIPFLALKSYRIIPGHRHAYVNITDSKRLVNDVRKIIPDGGILLCDKYLSTTIDYFSGKIHSFPVIDLQQGNDPVDVKIGYLLSRKIPVYICDYRGVDFGDYWKNELSSHFNIKPVSVHQPLYDFTDNNGKNTCNIYQVLNR